MNMRISQKQLNKNGLKIISAIGIVAAFVFLLFPFLPAMIMGAILAFALSDVVRFIERKGYSRRWALNSLIVASFFIFFIPTLAFLIRGSTLLTGAVKDPKFIERLTLLQSHLVVFLEKISPTIGISAEDMQKYIYEGIAKISTFIIDIFSQLLTQVPNLMLFTIIMIIAIYFFLVQEDNMRALFDKYFYFQKNKGSQFIQVLKSSSREVFLSNVLTGVIQALVVTIGAAICGFDEWFLILFITFICSFIPIIGAGPVAFVLSVYAFAVGGTGAGVGMLAISIISGLADNIIRPYLTSMGSVEVPGILSFIAVLGGVITMGLPGLFLGPFIACLIFGALPIIIDDLFHKPDEGISEQID